MKTLTKSEMLSDLFTGGKFRASAWEEDTYIVVDSGQVVTNENEAFNVMDSKEDEWVLWKKPKKKDAIITKEEALRALYDGKRVKATEWENEVLFVKDGQIMVNGKEPFNIMRANEKEWMVVTDEVKEELNELAELKAMVSELLKNKNKDGRNNEVQSNTNELLKAVYGVAAPKEIEEQFKRQLENAKSTKDIEKVVCEYIPYCWIGGRTLGTTSVYYSNMRKVIKDIENETYRDTALSLFLPPQSLYESVQTKISDNKKEVIRDKNVFDAKHIKELIVSIKEKILEDDYNDKPRQTALEREKAYWAYSYLTIVTGRRQSEILKTLSVRRKNKKSNYEYCGILKDREEGKCIKAFSLDDDFDFISDLVDYIQEHINAKDFTEKQINSKFNNSFNNALKRITGTHFTAKDFRDIYAEMLWIKNKSEKDSNIDKRDFKAEVLGHEYDGKLSATEHYDAWEAIDEE